MIVINSSTRQFNIPGADMTFGVEADAGSERKYFQCPRYVGNKLDIASSFVRINYRNANGEIDSYLVEDLTVDGDNVTFSWELSPKVTAYKGQLRFVMCVVGPDTKVAWHTTLGTGIVLEGLEPDYAMIQAGTADVVAQLIAMVDKQTAAVENKGAEWVRNVQQEGTDQVIAVQTAAQEAQTASVAEIEAKGVNVRESIPEDYTALSEAVDTLNRTRGNAIVCSVESSVVAVNDASDMPMQGMRIFGRSTQDGTPTPDAPVEIVSVDKPVVKVAGKNLLKIVAETQTVNGVTFTVNGDGTVTVNGTATADAFFEVNRSVTGVLDNTRYRLSGCPAGGSAGTYFLRASDRLTKAYDEFGEGQSFNYPDVSQFVVSIRVMGGTTVTNLLFAPMVRLAEIEDESYELYKEVQTVSTTHTLPGIPVTSGGNYTDENGQQWICDEVDLERGVYVQRIGTMTFTGEESWTKNQYYENTVQRSRGGLVSGSAVMCNMYAGNVLTENHGLTVGGALNVRDNIHAVDVETWKNHLRELYSNGTPIVVFGVLTTFIETPLTETEIAAYRALHSNYPNTTILNDAGAHMVVKYAADTKLYIDNKIAALVGGV